MSEHTPGPWEWGRIHSPDIQAELIAYVKDEHGVTICTCPQPNAIANANIIMDACDIRDLEAENAKLRKALQSLSDDVRDYGTGKLKVRDSCWQARAALNPPEDEK